MDSTELVRLAVVGLCAVTAWLGKQAVARIERTQSDHDKRIGQLETAVALNAQAIKDAKRLWESQ